MPRPSASWRGARRIRAGVRGSQRHDQSRATARRAAAGRVRDRLPDARQRVSWRRHRRTCSPLLTSPSLTIAAMGVISARAADDVVELRPEDARWLRFVAGASEASAFHEPGWLAALTASYGYQSLVIALVAPGGEV